MDGGQQTWQPKERIRLGSHADTEQCVLSLLVDLGLPVVDVILLGHGQVGEHGALRVEELDLGAGLDETVSDLELGLKLPGRDALFLDGQVLRQRDLRLGRLGWVVRDEGYK